MWDNQGKGEKPLTNPPKHSAYEPRRGGKGRRIAISSSSAWSIKKAKCQQGVHSESVEKKPE